MIMKLNDFVIITSSGKLLVIVGLDPSVYQSGDF